MRVALLALLPGALTAAEPAAAPAAWKLGTPIVTYWAGPGYPGGAAMTEAAARQLAEGGWNLVWCHEQELDVAQRAGLRALLTDPLLEPAALDDPARRAALDALVTRVRRHPALYAYHLTDEPAAGRFAEWGRLVAHLRELDPGRLAYINLFPTYASNEQLGNRGDVVTAYREHLRQFVERVRPALISYDHYQFAVGRDNPEYFLNLGLVRRAALDAGVPFLNIIQACTWTPAMRAPGEAELRYLYHTTLAYGAQGISQYVYSYPGHTPGVILADGTPTPVYAWLKTLNRDFAALASELQPMQSRGVFHAGMTPPGTEPWPAGAAFALDPPLPPVAYRPGQKVEGALVGLFGPRGESEATPTHAMVVNLDYEKEADLGLRGPAPLDTFDPAACRWSPASGTRAALRLPPGGGLLVRRRP
jgi:hypothetical protein